MTETTILTGRVLSFDGTPFDGTPTEAARFDGAVALAGGRIVARGTTADLYAAYPQAKRRDHGDKVICAGFVDPHVHY
ncbi:MAG: guanine deaminase, partial [Pseudodonghicola sp.]|nr:guanine deaminase [Pseudodonghicola sp.]